MIVEDKILEYLDGSLGEHESAELLETLAVSPEKRAILEEHLRLNDILALGRKPYSVPLATERALAERIPILSRPGIAPIPFGFRTALSGVRQWAGSRAIQTAAGVAALLAISTIAWLAMRPATSQLQVVGQQSISANSEIQAGKGAAKDIKDVRDGNDATSERTNSATSASTALHSTTTNYRTTHSAITPSVIMSSEETLSATTPFGTTPSGTMPSGTTPSGTTPSAINENQVIHPVTNFSQNDVLIPHESSASTLSEIERGDIQSRNPITIGADFATGQSYLPQSATIPAQSLINGEYAFTLDYDFSDNFAIGAEAGRETYASLNEQATPSTPIQGQTYSRIIYTSVIAATQTYYFCLTTHYTFAPESGYPIRIGLAGGIASTGEPTGMATAGISRVLSENLLLDLDLTFSVVWGITSQSAPYVQTTGGVEGIIRQDVPQQTTFTSGVGIRVGLRYRL